MAAPEIEKLVTLLARLPGLGPRSARRAALTLLRRREALMLPLADALAKAAAEVKSCTICGNLDARDPCGVCADERRDPTQLCVVEQVADLWAMERAGAFRGRYHVLGGTRGSDGAAYFILFTDAPGGRTSVDIVADKGR